MQDPNPDLVPLSAILTQLAKEITSVDQHINAVETMLKREVFGQALSPRQSADLQGIDQARQMLACLSTFLQTLSNGADSALKLDPTDAAKALSLNGLALRLANPHRATDMPKSGLVQFF